MWFAVIVFSCFEPFFGSAPGGAILPSDPHNGAAVAKTVFVDDCVNSRPLTLTSNSVGRLIEVWLDRQYRRLSAPVFHELHIGEAV